MGASDVLASCEGWLMVSQSSTTNCSVRASSNIRSISAWTSAEKCQEHINEYNLLDDPYNCNKDYSLKTPEKKIHLQKIFWEHVEA